MEGTGVMEETKFLPRMCQGVEEWRRNTLASSSFAFYHLSLPIGQISLETKGIPEFACDTEQYRLT